MPPNRVSVENLDAFLRAGWTEEAARHHIALFPAVAEIPAHTLISALQQIDRHLGLRNGRFTCRLQRMVRRMDGWRSRIQGMQPPMDAWAQELAVSVHRFPEFPFQKPLKDRGDPDHALKDALGMMASLRHGGTVAKTKKIREQRLRASIQLFRLHPEWMANGFQAIRSARQVSHWRNWQTQGDSERVWRKEDFRRAWICLPLLQPHEELLAAVNARRLLSANYAYGIADLSVFDPLTDWRRFFVSLTKLEERWKFVTENYRPHQFTSMGDLAKTLYLPSTEDFLRRLEEIVKPDSDEQEEEDAAAAKEADRVARKN